MPSTMDMNAMAKRYIARTLPLKCCFNKKSVLIFVAGPAIKNTKAAPGDKPFNIKVAAMGVDSTAQP